MGKKKTSESDVKALSEWRQREGRQVNEKVGLGNKIESSGQKYAAAAHDPSMSSSPPQAKKRRPSEAAMALFPSSTRKQNEAFSGTSQKGQEEEGVRGTIHGRDVGDGDSFQSAKAAGSPSSSPQHTRRVTVVEEGSSFSPQRREDNETEAGGRSESANGIPFCSGGGGSPFSSEGAVAGNHSSHNHHHIIGNNDSSSSALRRNSVLKSNYQRSKTNAERVRVEQIQEEYKQRSALGKIEAIRQMRVSLKKQRAMEEAKIKANPRGEGDEFMLKKVSATSAITGERVLLDAPPPFQVQGVILPTVSRNQRLLYEKIDPSTFKAPMPTSCLSVYQRALTLSIEEAERDHGGDCSSSDVDGSELLGATGRPGGGSTSYATFGGHGSTGNLRGGSRGSGVMVPVGASVGASLGAMTVMSQDRQSTIGERRGGRLDGEGTLSANYTKPLPSLKEVNRVVDEVCGPAVSRSRFAFGNGPSYWDQLLLYDRYMDAVGKADHPVKKKSRR